MGEAKRRKTALKEKYGQEALSWLMQKPSTKVCRMEHRGAWIGIGMLVVAWITVRFLGPARLVASQLEPEDSWVREHPPWDLLYNL